MDIVILLASVLAAAPPILFAVLGETITEKAGVINLSLDGSILLSAMTAFIVATTSGVVPCGTPSTDTWAPAGSDVTSRRPVSPDTGARSTYCRTTAPASTTSGSERLLMPFWSSRV